METTHHRFYTRSHSLGKSKTFYNQRARPARRMKRKQITRQGTFFVTFVVILFLFDTVSYKDSDINYNFNRVHLLGRSNQAG